MKITPEILAELDAEIVPSGPRTRKWKIWRLAGFLLVRGVKDNIWYFNSSLDDADFPYTGHSVTHIEEFFRVAYEDGYREGQDAFKAELRELIGAKDK
jgi:hypothetical protein